MKLSDRILKLLSDGNDYSMAEIVEALESKQSTTEKIMAYLAAENQVKKIELYPHGWVNGSPKKSDTTRFKYRLGLDVNSWLKKAWS